MNSAKLERVISVMSLRLESYCKRHDSRQEYIDLQNSLISDLVDVHNSLLESRSHFLNPLEKEILRLQALDPQLSGHLVKIRTKAKGNNFSYINLNLNEQTDIY
jgi:hypothetical protein